VSKVFLLAGEKSGDLHGGNLAKEIKGIAHNAQLQGWGGREMQNSGVEVLQDYHEMAFMGLDFIRHFGRIRALFGNCKRDITEFNPDVLVLIDYSGFNLRIAKWAKKKGFKVVYYIAPKTWAWNASRNKSIKKFVDKLLVILPFEEAYFSSKDILTEYVGNPLVNHINNFVPTEGYRQSLIGDKDYLVAILPGSRFKEIDRSREELKKVAKQFPQTLFAVAGISELNEQLYLGFDCIQNCILLYDQTYELLSIADAAFVNSGTATLETALFNVPQIVVYKTGALTYLIASQLVKIKYISLVNLILDKPAIPELIQENFNSAKLNSHLKELLFDTKKRKIQLDYYKDLKIKLGELNGSKNAAKSVLNIL
jgi:lipid-A-disaccharide synthase